MRRIYAILLLAGMTACSTPGYDNEDSVFQALPQSWQRSDEWQFFVADNNQEPLGDLRLYLTNRPLESEDCDVTGWYRADVIENNLNYKLEAELAPGYKIIGPWITLDLAATSCNIGYKMVGTVTDQGAKGHFNFVHSLGGENIGEFLALPADAKQDGDDKQAFSIED